MTPGRRLLLTVAAVTLGPAALAGATLLGVAALAPSSEAQPEAPATSVASCPTYEHDPVKAAAATVPWAEHAAALRRTTGTEPPPHAEAVDRMYRQLDVPPYIQHYRLVPNQDLTDDTIECEPDGPPVFLESGPP